MSGFGAKLSRHVLGMKFMRKTKDQVDKEKVEKVHREHFASPVAATSSSSIKSENKVKQEQHTPAAVPVVIEELWSYNQCERYILGRQSYGGFNPAVENNVKKGIWKPFYLDEAATPQSDSEDDEKMKQEGVDVSDEEMAKIYGSLVGTLAKHFRKKHKKEAEEEKNEDVNDNSDNGVEEGEIDSGSQNKKKKWTKRFQRNKNKNQQGQHRQGQGQHQNRQGQGQHQNKRGGGGRNQLNQNMWNKEGNRKRQRESTGSTHYNENRRGEKPKKSPFSTPGNSQEEERVPPNKKRRFMKPSDD